MVSWGERRGQKSKREAVLLDSSCKRDQVLGKNTAHDLVLSTHITRIPGKEMVVSLLRGEQAGSETQ